MLNWIIWNTTVWSFNCVKTNVWYLIVNDTWQYLKPVRSPDGDTEYFDIVAGVLQGDMPPPCFFIICLDYVLRASIDKIRENDFELTKKRSRRYPAKTTTDTDYVNDTAILANTHNQAKTLLNNLEQAAVV